MAIDDTTTLNAGLGATLTRAWKPGVLSSPGNILEMVTNTEAAFTMRNSANQGSDADGDYLECIDPGGDYTSVADTLDPSGNVFTLIVCCKLSDVTPVSSYNGLCG